MSPNLERNQVFIRTLFFASAFFGLLQSFVHAQTVDIQILDTPQSQTVLEVDFTELRFDLFMSVEIPVCELAVEFAVGTSGMSITLDEDEKDKLTKCFEENPEPVRKDGESDKDYNARRQQWKNDIKSCMNQHPPRESDGYTPP